MPSPEIPEPAASEPTSPEPAAVGANDAFAVFRPRRGRVVAMVLAGLAVVVFGVVSVALPGRGEGGAWSVGDRLMIFGCGVAVAALLYRYATIRAVPTREGLTVRNLIRTERVDWRRVVFVQFSGGDPWVTLEMDDTELIAVMAVQKADGLHGQAEASRLAALVQGLG